MYIYVCCFNSQCQDFFSCLGVAETERSKTYLKRHHVMLLYSSLLYHVIVYCITLLYPYCQFVLITLFHVRLYFDVIYHIISCYIKMNHIITYFIAFNYFILLYLIWYYLNLKYTMISETILYNIKQCMYKYICIYMYWLYHILIYAFMSYITIYTVIHTM